MPCSPHTHKPLIRACHCEARVSYVIESLTFICNSVNACGIWPFGSPSLSKNTVLFAFVWWHQQSAGALLVLLLASLFFHIMISIYFIAFHFIILASINTRMNIHTFKDATTDRRSALANELADEGEKP